MGDRFNEIKVWATTAPLAPEQTDIALFIIDVPGHDEQRRQTMVAAKKPVACR